MAWTWLLEPLPPMAMPAAPHIEPRLNPMKRGFPPLGFNRAAYNLSPKTINPNKLYQLVVSIMKPRIHATAAKHVVTSTTESCGGDVSKNKTLMSM